jgi:hypothetical protein
VTADDEQLVAELAEAMRRRLGMDCPDYWPDLNSWAADLLPVVLADRRRAVADELMWAATEAECRRDLDMLKRRAEAVETGP